MRPLFVDFRGLSLIAIAALLVLGRAALVVREAVVRQVEPEARD